LNRLKLVLTELLVAESPPQIPTRHRTKGPPSFAETLNIAGPAIDVPDGTLKSDVPQWKHIWFSKDHDAEHRNCPRSNTLYSGERLFPRLAVANFTEDLL
jgi:hypothetical protein